jgi:hypothetical protein
MVVVQDLHRVQAGTISPPAVVIVNVWVTSLPARASVAGAAAAIRTATNAQTRVALTFDLRHIDRPPCRRRIRSSSERGARA